MRQLTNNLALSLVSVVLMLAVLELGLPAFVEVTDNIDYEHLPGVGLRLKPGQHGLYIRDGGQDRDAIRARFHANSAGFNNLQTYSKTRQSGKYRIAVIGDSFVEALHVDPDRALSAVLARELERLGLHVEVYSFGISGFGTAQIYNLIMKYVLSYSPDAIVYLFIANDVPDSSPFVGGSQWTQQYDLAANGELVALPFEKYRLSPYRKVLKRSSLFRYIYYQRRLSETIQTWRSSPGPDTQQEGPSSEEEDKSWLIVDLLLQNLNRKLAEAGVPWLLVWQGDADPNYRANAKQRLGAIAGRQKIDYFDLSKDFSEDYGVHGRWFRIKGDGHWNEDGHRVAGGSLARVLAERLGHTRGSKTVSEGN